VEDAGERATNTESWTCGCSDVLGAGAVWLGSAEVMCWHRSMGPESMSLVESERWEADGTGLCVCRICRRTY
jgi:hypothetical protein